MSIENKIEISMNEHVSVQVAAALFRQRFGFAGVPHDLRVTGLFSLIRMYEAVIEAGAVEHTSDWDWYIKVRTTEWENGKKFNCWEIQLEFTDQDEVLPEDYTSRFKRWQFLKCWVYDGDDLADDPVLVKIDDITSVEFIRQ